jgi:hypothetical protein
MPLQFHTVTGTTQEFPDSYLLVAIDETGHEQPSSHHPAFGLGGCAFPIAMYTPWVRDPWRELKAAHFGGPDVPLHAVDLPPTEQQAEALGTFFRQGRFGRIGALTSVATSSEVPIPDYPLVAGFVVDRIGRLVEHFNCNGAVLVHEESARTDSLAATHFDFPWITGPGSTQLPFVKFRMPKSANEPFLEVADFIMHAAGGQVRASLAGRAWGDRKDFQAVFLTTPPELSEFREIQEIKAAPRPAR